MSEFSEFCVLFFTKPAVARRGDVLTLSHQESLCGALQCPGGGAGSAIVGLVEFLVCMPVPVAVATPCAAAAGPRARASSKAVAAVFGMGRPWGSKVNKLATWGTDAGTVCNCN